MKFSLVFVGSALAAAQFVAAQGNIVVSTLSSVRVCSPNRLTWNGGQAPYQVSVIVPNQSSQTLQQLGTTSDNFLVWTPDGSVSGISVGDTVAIYVIDASGVANGSSGIPVQAGGSTSCQPTPPVNGGGASSTGASSSSSAPATSSEAAPTTTSTTASRPTSTVSLSSSSSSSRPTTSTSTSSTAGAAPTGKSYAAFVAGAVGVAAAALL